MPRKKSDPFTKLTWDDLEEWAGSRIAGRGRTYQQQGRVSELVKTSDGALVAWVAGSDRYATLVDMDTDGLPSSNCSCPYGIDCKHAVAVLLEYLNRLENNRDVPAAGGNDERMAILADEYGDDEDDDEILSGHPAEEIEGFLKGKTKARLIELILELAREYPEIARDLAYREQLGSGNTNALVTRLRKEIREIGEEPGWQNDWEDDGFIPDYSGVRNKLEALLKAGHADDVLTLGRELIDTGTRQVAESNDEGETEMEIAACMPVIVEALDRSSLSPVEKLAWAVDAELEDQFEICAAFEEYLDQEHPKEAWHALADRLLLRLAELKRPKGDDGYSRHYARDRLSNWTIHALEEAGREDEIIPLCEAEAKRTGSYDRLVECLMAEHRFEEAERWIHEGIRATEKAWPGIAAGLRTQLQNIRTQQDNRPAVAAMQAEEFVRHSSLRAFTDSKKAAGKAKVWPTVRRCLLVYLEKGILPWKQEDWPLPESGLDAPEPDRKERFPMVDDLMEIAMLEKKPDQVLHWYDQQPKRAYDWFGSKEDRIAEAVKEQFPDRAIAFWTKLAEDQIARVKVNAYYEAAEYLRKLKHVLAETGRKAEWEAYLTNLRKKHARKPRLMEILDGVEGRPILKKKR